MSQKIQFRRGLQSEVNVAFDQGEPVWLTDKSRLLIGNGMVTGGLMVAMIASGVPATITSPGISGQMITSSSYLYVATGDNQWGRVALVGW